MNHKRTQDDNYGPMPLDHKDGPKPLDRQSKDDISAKETSQGKRGEEHKDSSYERITAGRNTVSNNTQVDHADALNTLVKPKI